MTQEQAEQGADTGFDPERLRTAPLQMRRSRTDRHIAGVCGGFAAYARIDPVVVRVVVAALSIAGAGLVLYGAAWLLVPEEGSDAALVDGYHRSGTEDVRRLGWILAGVLALGSLISAGPWFDLWFPLPLAALALIAWLWFFRDSGSGAGDAASVGPAYAAAPAGPANAGAPPASTPVADVGAPVAPGDDRPPGGVPPAPPGPLAGATAGRLPRPRRGDGTLWRLTTGVALVVLGALWIVDRTVTDLAPAAYVAAVLAVLGGGLLVGTRIGNGRGLIPLVLLLLPALLVTSQVTVWTAGQIVQTPTTAADLAPTYELGAGRVWLDLSRIEDLDALDGRVVHIEVTTGEVVVTVPEAVDLTVSASSVAGEIDVLGTRDEGFRNDVDVTETDTDGPDLHLVIEGFAGRMEVSRS